MPKPRLKRLEWVYTDYPVYFITACVLARRRLLANPSTHAVFVEFAKKAAERDIHVGRYVLMADHLHLFGAFCSASPALSLWGKALKGALSADLRHRGRKAPYWQKGFFDHVLRSAELYRQKWEYVRQNPVRAGLVAKAEDWPYQGEIFRLECNGALDRL